MIQEKQTVQIRRDQIQFLKPEMGRLLDRRKGKVIDVFVPLGAKEAVVKVRWIARRPSENDVTLEHPEKDLEVIPS
ncbi:MULTISPECIES: hypothetical protein [Deefgea]|uniref:Uncharacterized protein n=1 Tax=Deefgea chitinilytica TaxID=570276 RepID=A0ABS2C7G9_9NEIS|nr:MULTISPECIES: hypothetical protein [Deefgea]MBM5570107.1 hypothetical protein [Deefgea chitinilytica]MBM9887336.1 hypothetical protein [Deefgea sp. CFH1-16]